MVVVTEMQEPSALKDEGNTFFKKGQFPEAIECYTKALKSTTKGSPDAAVLHKNRAACYLKQEQHSEAAKDCTEALDISPNDPKALFRRCQAFEGLERFEDAYKDAVMLLRVEPKNKAIQPLLGRLQPIIQAKVDEQSLTGSKVQQMFNLTFKDKAVDEEKRKQAANNLIVLAREEAGAEKMYASGGCDMLLTLMDGKDGELRITAIRVMACMAQNSKKRALGILEKMGLKKIMNYMFEKDDTLSTASANLLKNILNAITDIENIRVEREKYETARLADSACKLRPFVFIADKIDPSVMPTVDAIFLALIQCLNVSKVSAMGRDNALELIIKYVTRKDGTGWSTKFIDKGGIQPLLEVAGAIVEHKSLPVTENSRMHASLALANIYSDLIGDKDRDKYREAVEAFFVDLFGDSIMESKVEAVMALAALLQGPFEVGNMILGRTGVLEMILAMADSDNAMHVKYAVEALVHSSSKKDRCSGVIKQATPILKELYQSKNEYIKVRALVGLCKLGSFGGTDASRKSFADGSTQTLAKACRKFLKNPGKDADLRKWAAEGLAYLTLDADVKDELAEDTDALKSLIELAKLKDKGILYPVAQVLVNLTNAYDKKDPEPELVELAKFAKHHVPEEHDKDKESFVTERVNKLVKAGMINALVAFSKTESENSKELVARVYLAVSTVQEHRGLLVQQGGAKALVPLALEGSKEGRYKAAQALAKIGITMNPETAFPGQRMCEIVRPLISLLDMERSALENFEALLALTNLASINSTIRKRMLKEHIFSKVEYYIYEEHEHLKRAALECMCNLMMEEECLRYFKGDNDRVKYLLLCSGECMEDDDLNVCRATAGGLAMISYDKDIAEKILSCTKQWYEILQSLAIHPVPQIQHRGMHIVLNIMTASKEIADKIINSPLLEILMAFSRIDDPERASVKTTASRCLEKAVEWKLIKPTAEGESQPISRDVLARLLATFATKKEEKPEAAKPEPNMPSDAQLDDIINKVVKRGEQLQAGTKQLQENETPHKLTITELPDDHEEPSSTKPSAVNGDAAKAKSQDTTPEKPAQTTSQDTTPEKLAQTTSQDTTPEKPAQTTSEDTTPEEPANQPKDNPTEEPGQK